MLAGKFGPGQSATLTGALLAVVVIGRNEGTRLARSLASLRQLEAPIFYVDSASTDGSVALAARAGAHVVELSPTESFTAARARNAGAQEARTLFPRVEQLLFIDGDCVIKPAFVTAASAVLLSNPQAAVVCGRRRERDSGHSVFNRLCELEWNTPVGEADACGGDALMRAAVFFEVGGFNGRLTAGEEPELCLRMRKLGWTVQRIAEDMTIHDAAMTTLGQWWRRNMRGGYGYAQVWDTTRHQASPLYAKELKRAALWAGAVPAVAISVSALSVPLAFGVLALPLVQTARIALRRRGNDGMSWPWAAFTMLAKLPELQGALRYAVQRSSRPRSAIRYK